MSDAQIRWGLAHTLSTPTLAKYARMGQPLFGKAEIVKPTSILLQFVALLAAGIATASPAPDVHAIGGWPTRCRFYPSK